MSESILPLLILLAVWYFLGFFVARENERVVKILLGKPYALKDSGLGWAPFLLAKLRRYTKNIVELGGAQDPDTPEGTSTEFSLAEIITKAEEGNSDDKAQSARIKARVSFRFYWPSGSALWQGDDCPVALLPNPEDKAALIDIFEESILEHVRTVGSRNSWPFLYRDRTGFAHQVNESIKADPNNIINRAHLDDKWRVVIDLVIIPQELEMAIDGIETARMQKLATIRTAQGEKEKRALEGKGTAEARAALFEAIQSAEGGLQYEALYTLREMAQGTSNTILPIPTDVLDALKSTGSGGGIGIQKILAPLAAALAAMTPDQQQKAIDAVMQSLGKGGLK